MVKKLFLFCSTWTSASRWHYTQKLPLQRSRTRVRNTFPRKPLNAGAEIQPIGKLVCCYHGDGAGTTLLHYSCKQAKRAFTLMHVHYAEWTLMSGEVRQNVSSMLAHWTRITGVLWHHGIQQRDSWETKPLHKSSGCKNIPVKEINNQTLTRANKTFTETKLLTATTMKDIIDVETRFWHRIKT